MRERRTEVDGWVAIWEIAHWNIRIMLVRSLVDSARPLLKADVAASAPDLADMREEYPNLSRLWDAVRHEYWAEVITPQKHSEGTI
ncbi:hypothetical protein OG874_05130 [Nocardia sp. NBC_00565]|uniref:hypothetical protein n=1 Tax=Nocardia sp. NBC_00565 TaxID=2975993 RepID=UPI002E82304A|nr:hypothetical protein [Nocardia sp. NBC_00565]WUC04577.1 hypothetical protein OG874_05130 [Nocardia sp. NBC_00565]